MCFLRTTGISVLRIDVERVGHLFYVTHDGDIFSPEANQDTEKTDHYVRTRQQFFIERDPIIFGRRIKHDSYLRWFLRVVNSKV